MYAVPRIYLSLPECTPPPLLNICVRPSQNPPLPTRIYPSLPKYIPGFRLLYVTLPEYTPHLKTYATFPASTHPRIGYGPLLTTRYDAARIYPFQKKKPFLQLHAMLQFIHPSHKIPPLSNIYMRPSRNSPVPPRIYPFQTYNIPLLPKFTAF